MVTKVFSGGRLVLFGAVVVFLTTGTAHALPPGRPPLPPPGGPRIPGGPRPIGPHIGPLPHHVPPRFPLPYHPPLYGGYGAYYIPYRYPYVPHYGGYGAYYPYYEYSYVPSYSNYGAVLTIPANPAPTTEEKDVATRLAASGIRTDEGRPVWPLALRVLPGQEAQALRGQIDGLLKEAATQAARGRPNTAVVDEMAQATDRLRKVLRRYQEERGVLAQSSYEEAKRFLDKLAGAQKLLR